MKRTGFALFVVPRAVALAFLAMLVVTLFWATAAQAQTPAADQYGEPTAVAGGGGGSAQAGGGGGGGSAQAGGAQATAGGGGGSPGTLPATGGPAFLAYAGVLAAAGAGLMLLRSGRGR